MSHAKSRASLNRFARAVRVTVLRPKQLWRLRPAGEGYELPGPRDRITAPVASRRRTCRRPTSRTAPRRPMNRRASFPFPSPPAPRGTRSCPGVHSPLESCGSAPHRRPAPCPGPPADTNARSSLDRSTTFSRSIAAGATSSFGFRSTVTPRRRNERSLNRTTALVTGHLGPEPLLGRAFQRFRDPPARSLQPYAPPGSPRSRCDAGQTLTRQPGRGTRGARDAHPPRGCGNSGKDGARATASPPARCVGFRSDLQSDGRGRTPVGSGPSCPAGREKFELSSCARRASPAP